jgi:hypothetical protein
MEATTGKIKLKVSCAAWGYPVHPFSTSEEEQHSTQRSNQSTAIGSNARMKLGRHLESWSWSKRKHNNYNVLLLWYPLISMVRISIMPCSAALLSPLSLSLLSLSLLPPELSRTCLPVSQSANNPLSFGCSDHQLHLPTGVLPLQANTVRQRRQECWLYCKNARRREREREREREKVKKTRTILVFTSIYPSSCRPGYTRPQTKTNAMHWLSVHQRAG